jgi:hypothetical protein
MKDARTKGSKVSDGTIGRHKKYSEELQRRRKYHEISEGEEATPQQNEDDDALPDADHHHHHHHDHDNENEDHDDDRDRDDNNDDNENEHVRDALVAEEEWSSEG